MSELFALLPDNGLLRFFCDAVWQTSLLAGLTWCCVRCLALRPAVRSWLIVVGLSLCLAAPLLSVLARQHGYGLIAVAPGADKGAGSEIYSAPAKDGFARETLMRKSPLRPRSPIIAAPGAATNAPVHESAPVDRSAINANGDRSSLVASFTKSSSWAAGLAILWSATSALLLVRLGASALAIGRMLRHSRPCQDSTILLACRGAALRLGLRRTPCVLVSDLVGCPTVKAWGPPCVFVPMAAREGADWFAVFCHELAHIRRGDGARRLLVELATILIPWQPLMWLLRRENELACEEACDDWVVFAGADPVKYAWTLALWSRRQQVVLALGFSNRFSMIRRRIERLLQNRGGPQPSVSAAWRLNSAAAALVLVMIIPLLQTRGVSMSPPDVRSESVRPFRAAAGVEAAGEEPAPNVVLKSFGDPRFKHAGRSRVLGFDASGQTLITACESIGTAAENLVRIWQVDTGRQVRVLEHFNRGVELTPDGRNLLIGKPDGAVEVIDVDSHDVHREIHGPAQWRAIFAISDDGARLATCGVSAEARKKVTVWDLSAGRSLSQIDVAGVRARGGFALSPDGRLLAATDGRTLAIWDVDAGQEIRSFTVPAEGGGYNALAFTPDGQSVVAAAYRGWAQVWSTDTCELTATFRIPSHVQAISFSKDGRSMATVDFYGVSSWSWPGAELVWRTPLSRFSVSPADAAAVFHADGQTLAVGVHHSALLLDARTGKAIHPGSQPLEQYAAMDLHPDGSRLAVATTDGAIKVWSVETDKLVVSWSAHADSIRRLCYSPDGAMLAAASDDGDVSIWNPATGAIIRQLPQSLHVAPYYLGFSSDSSTLVSSCEGSSTNLWNVSTGELFGALTGDRGGLRGPVAFSPDEKTLFTIDSFYNVSLWNTSDRRLVTTLSERQNSVKYLTLSQDGRTVAAGNSTRLTVWDVATQEKRFDQRVAQLNNLAFSPEGALVAALGKGKLEFLNAESGVVQRTINIGENGGAIRQICFGPRGNRAYTLNANGMVDVLAL